MNKSSKKGINPIQLIQRPTRPRRRNFEADSGAYQITFITMSTLENFLKENDLESLHKAKSDLEEVIESCRIELGTCLDDDCIKRVTATLEYATSELRKCRDYRERVILALDHERNVMIHELAINKRMDVLIWLQEYGLRFQMFWDIGTHDKTQLTFVLYNK